MFGLGFVFFGETGVNADEGIENFTLFSTIIYTYGSTSSLASS
jgi:hypothetical protein